MTNYIIAPRPLSAQQQTDLEESGFSSPRLPLDGSAQCIVAFDGDIPSSFSGLATFSWEQIQIVTNGMPWSWDLTF